MQLPELQEIPKTQRSVYTFGGYNATNDNSDWVHGRRAYTAEFSEMLNMSSKGYPALVSRPVRGDLTKTGYGQEHTVPRHWRLSTSTYGCIWKDSDGASCTAKISTEPVFYNPLISMNYLSDVVAINDAVVGYSTSTGEMKMVQQNPDVGTAFDQKDITWDFTNTGDYVMYVVPCLKSGNQISLPVNAAEGFLRSATFDNDGVMSAIDMQYGSETAKTLNLKPDGTLVYAWSDGTGHTEGVPTAYCAVKIIKSDWSEALDLSQEFGKEEVINFDNTGSSLTDKVDGAITIKGFSGDWMIITRFGRSIRTGGTFKVYRNVPKFTKIIQSNNRLWGGTENGREICATQLGQPSRWQVFAGDAADSIALTVGTNGPFTGACELNDMPTFFKEDHIHFVTGKIAQSAVIQSVETVGVAEGCMDSLKVINGVAYFVGKDGVYCNNGGRSSLISKSLGKLSPTFACAGVVDAKYYVNIKQDGKDTLYVYDTEYGLWHIEDHKPITSMLQTSDDLYLAGLDFLSSVKGGTFYPYTATAENPVEWKAVSEPIDYTNIRAKYVNRIIFKLVLDAGAEATVSMQYDNKGEWEQATTVMGIGETKPHTVWIIPKRCHTYKYKIEGRGNVQIISVTNFYQEGSDIWL